ncbi:MAG TPA: enoyl-CoA hydratase/isomerase family protein [Acidimicrobiia bacterium]|nr:enoyl-CoA hydratase/isomerase family protein [Acidimicrobiia bacterium]
MELVEYTVDGPVALVRLNRPPVNALSPELSRDLLAAFAEAADPTVRAVVVTGQPHFAAGADIKGFQSVYEEGGEQKLASTLVEAIWALDRLEKPTIAAIHGYALGGGLELAMGADFRYLADDAKVGQPEIKLGLIPGAGGTQRLQRLVGFQRAKDIVYTGRQVGAEEALAIGLADRVFPAADVLAEAQAAARELAGGPTRALYAAKQALAGGHGRPLAEGMDLERAAFDASFWTDDAREGVSAFIEKRPPSFQGK